MIDSPIRSDHALVERRRRQANALRKNIDSLRAQKLVPNNVVIRIDDQSAFADAYKTAIAPELNRYPGAPTFALVDPFGWIGLPMAIMRDLMHRQRTEVLVNFMFEEINRFLNHPDQPENFVDRFGAPRWRKGYDLIGPARRTFLHDFYQKQLHTMAGARYVRSFEMLNQRGTSDCFLFFAPNNRLGLSKMTQAMWRVDLGAGARFSDTTNPGQLVLLQPEPDRHQPRLILLARFSSCRVRVHDIEQFVIEETGFHGGHYKKVLADLAAAGPITIVSPPISRRKGTFAQPSLVLEFS